MSLTFQSGPLRAVLGQHGGNYALYEIARHEEGFNRATIVLLHRFANTDEPLRFSDLEKLIKIAPNTLSNRLEELTKIGLLTRTAYNKIPPRVEYKMTEKAEELSPVFWYLGVWTERHDLDPVGGSENNN